MYIAVIDGQGGGLGRIIVEAIKEEFGGDVTIIALGTNVLATQQMLKAGADLGATGENAIVVNVHTVDVVMGSLGIVAANSLLGELTPKMASAVAACRGKKILIPYNKCNLLVASKPTSIPVSIGYAMELLKEEWKK